MDKVVLLIDGNALLHRAFHAFPPLTNKEGKRMEAVFGFFSVLFRYLKNFSPSTLAVCFDRPGPTFRNELFKEYQAQRPKTDEALIPQIILLHQVLDDIGISTFEKDGFEGDDVIGSLTKNFQQSTKVIIATGDKDILQLVNNNIKVCLPVKGLSGLKLFGEKEVEEKLGVKPNQIIDYKALVGDPSDNYPGVRGIGPKTAISLLSRFGTLEKIYKNLNKIELGLREKLEKNKENAFVSKKLATIVQDVPLENIKLSAFDREKTREILLKYGLKAMAKRLEEGKPIEEKKEEKQMKLF